MYLIEEAYRKGGLVKFFPLFRSGTERGAPYLVPGLGELGVKRGMSGIM